MQFVPCTRKLGRSSNISMTVKWGVFVMINERPNVHLLLTILVIFSASVGILHGRKKIRTLATQIDMDTVIGEGITTLSLDEAYDYLHSLVQSRNIRLLGQVIGQFSASAAKNLAEKILNDQSIPLTQEEKIRLLFATTLQMQKKKGAQYLIFDLLLTHKELQQVHPALLVAADSAYTKAIPPFIKWIKNRLGNKAYQNDHAYLNAMVNRALSQAVYTNDVNALDVMLSKTVRIKPQKASQLLWRAVCENKDTAFVPFLVRRAEADVNFSGDNKQTLLIKAVRNNNVDMVRALLEEGAKVNMILDPEVGSALQIAIGKKLVSIELRLRYHGALE